MPRTRAKFKRWIEVARSAHGLLIVIFFSVMVVGMFVLIVLLASQAGRESAGRNWGTFPKVMVVATEKLDDDGIDSRYANSLSQVQTLYFHSDRLIYASAKNYFLTRQESFNAAPLVIRVPRSENIILLSATLISPMFWRKQ